MERVLICVPDDKKTEICKKWDDYNIIRTAFLNRGEKELNDLEIKEKHISDSISEHQTESDRYGTVLYKLDEDKKDRKNNLDSYFGFYFFMFCVVIVYSAIGFFSKHMWYYIVNGIIILVGLTIIPLIFYGIIGRIKEMKYKKFSNLKKSENEIIANLIQQRNDLLSKKTKVRDKYKL